MNVTHDSLAAFVYVDVVDLDSLLAATFKFFIGFDMKGKGTHELVGLCVHCV